MTPLPAEAAALILAIAAITVLAILSTLASMVRNATMVRDLQSAAARLRINYAKQLSGNDDEVIEVDEVVEPEPGPPA